MLSKLPSRDREGAGMPSFFQQSQEFPCYGFFFLGAGFFAGFLVHAVR